ncbi:MAG: SpoIIE family protein phosphatase [Lentisphaerota bacterium]
MSEESSSSTRNAAPAYDALTALRHELRTPLNQIIGYSEMLQEIAEEDHQDSYLLDLQKIHRAAKHLVGLINEHLAPGKMSVVAHPPAAFAAPPVQDSPAVTQPPPGHAPADPALAMDSKSAEACSILSPPPAEATRSAPTLRGHLLVVDDNEMNRDMLARRLERQGHTVETARDGLEAMEIVRTKAFDLLLLDIMMPGLDGYSVLQRLKADPEKRHLPVIMISALDKLESVVRCIEAGAEDYLSKPFESALLRARISASLEKKYLRDQEQRTYHALVESQSRLAAELAKAADYVTSLLPPTLSGEIKTEWRFIPSTQLGGDAFGYHWLDDQHFAMYLLDVCGHGVGAALLSISVMNVLRTQSLPTTDFLDPGAVLGALNDRFPMENQNNMFFTIWYGVYHKGCSQLSYASGGHPPAVLLQPNTDGKPSPAQLLGTPGMLVGYVPDQQYGAAQCPIIPGSKLFILSDGAFEITRSDGQMLDFDQFIQHLAEPSTPCQSDLDRLIGYARQIQQRDHFDDDFSVMKISF